MGYAWRRVVVNRRAMAKSSTLPARHKAPGTSGTQQPEWILMKFPVFC